MAKKKILVFSGAGVSAESGVKTFRDHGGIWEGFDPMEVASISGWGKNPEKVLEFYNMRKNELRNVSPNAAHFAIAELEKDFDVTVVTQNVDDLHERAGSTNIIHLHGTLTLTKEEDGSEDRYPYTDDLKIGSIGRNGSQLRPDIVWFGENLSSMNLHKTQVAAEEADVCIVVGTSMQVSPANSVPWMTPELALIYYVDPGEQDFYVPKFRMNGGFFTHVKKKASEGMTDVIEELKRIYLK